MQGSDWVPTREQDLVDLAEKKIVVFEEEKILIYMRIILWKCYKTIFSISLIKDI